MRYQVPQFINIEDKLFGPLTIKQFIYVVGGVGLIYVIYNYLPFYLAIILIAPVALLSIALAFIPVNGKPFIFTMYAAIQYALSSRMYLWKKVPKKIQALEGPEKKSGVNIPVLSESKLKDLTWALDINQNVKRKI